jgi:ATP-dependent DNA helicase HFM1/MER3
LRINYYQVTILTFSQLSALSQAAEFKEIRFRQGEKNLYKTLNSNALIRFPILATLNLPAHKVSLIIQSVLGGVDILWDKDTGKHQGQYQNEVATVFKHVRRFIRCIIDCQISLRDSVAIQHALLIQRSLSARAWDDSPNQMRQLPDIGSVASKRFANAGIRSIEDLELTEPHRIEMILKRNPPFGIKFLEKLKIFPKLHVSIQIVPNTVGETT